MKRPKLIDKQIKKRSAGKCYLCEEDNILLLDCHRILEGKDGGRYVDHNVIVVCSLCHRKIHAGQIVVDRWYQGTGGRILHYTENGEEKWK